MSLKDWMEVLTAVATIGAVIVALIAISQTKKGIRQQILTGKLESLVQELIDFSQYYQTFMHLFFSVQAYKDSTNKEIQGLDQYYEERDKHLRDADKKKIEDHLLKILVLTECYTRDKLKDELLKYHRMMHVFFELVYMGGSMTYEVHYRNGFPSYDEYDKIVKKLKDDIISEIKIQ